MVIAIEPTIPAIPVNPMVSGMIKLLIVVEILENIKIRRSGTRNKINTTIFGTFIKDEKKELYDVRSLG